MQYMFICFLCMFINQDNNINYMLIYVIFALLIIYYLLNSVMMPSKIMAYMNGIEKLEGTNFTKWKFDLMIVLAIMDRDNSFSKDK
jgi:hypothetical protein